MMESHQERANLSGGIARRPFSTHASICAILFYFVSVVCVCVCEAQYIVNVGGVPQLA